MVQKLILLTGLLAWLASCSPASSAPAVTDTPLAQTQSAASANIITSTPNSAPSRTPRPSITPTPIVEEITPTPAPMYVLDCVRVPTGGYYINLTSQRTLHTTQISFDLLETTGSFVAGQLPVPTLTIDTSGGKLFGHTETEMAACQTAGACTATYESRLLFMKITCSL